jgi:DNA replication protein DnaC
MSDDACTTCGGAGFYVLDVDIYDPEFGKLQRCQCQGAATTARLLKKSDVNPAKSFASFTASFAPAAYRAARSYAMAPGGILYLHGEPGCGKTHLAHAIANSALSEGIEAAFRVVPDLLFEMRSSFKSRGEDSFDAKLERLRVIPLLVLDDYGAERSSDWATELLFQIINHRYERHLATIITSNLPPTHTHYSPRLQSRFDDQAAATVVHILAADYRRRPMTERVAA